MYKNGVDVTAQVMAAGDEHLVSGRVLTLKKLAAGGSDGGTRYVVLIEANVNGNRERRKLLIRVARADTEG